MAVAETSTYDPTVRSVVTQALRLSGRLGADGAVQGNDLAVGMDFLNNIIKSLHNDGHIVRCTEPTLLTLTAGTASYDLPTETLDVKFPMTVLDSSNNESQVLEMSESDWMLIPDKTTTVTGLPTRCYVKRLALKTLYLNPVPSGDWVSVRYLKVRLLRDVSTGNATIDLSPNWIRGIVYELAHDLSMFFGAPINRLKYLRGIGKEERKEAVGESKPSGDLIVSWRF